VPHHAHLADALDEDVARQGGEVASPPADTPRRIVTF